MGYNDIRQLQADVVFRLKKTPPEERAGFTSPEAEELALALTEAGHPGIAVNLRAALYLRCPYCWEPLLYVFNRAKTLYGDSAADYGAAWACFTCGAHVGVHKHKPYPLGSAAKKELRHTRNMTHRVVDPNWRLVHSAVGRKLDRNALYAAMAATLGIPLITSHISLFDEQACHTVMLAHYHPSTQSMAEFAVHGIAGPEWPLDK